MGELLGSIGVGIGVGVGAVIGFRAMDYLMGPRAAPKITTFNSVGSADACISHAKVLQDCLNSSGSDISKCLLYKDLLSECRRTSSASATSSA